MGTWQLTVLAAAAAGALAACGGGEATDDGGPADLTAADFSFSPAELSAAAGEETAFEVANDGDAEHNVTITELDVDQDIEPGAHLFVTVTPPEPGSYEFFCAYHPDTMTGTLTVQ